MQRTSHLRSGPTCRTAAASTEWWRQAVVYQICPRSFADSDADGLGDLRGIISRIPYLTALGVDAVWLSPFRPAAPADDGYDVDDGADATLGTLADFAEMTVRLRANGIKVIPDGLGQAFNVDLLEANWNAGEFLRVITDSLVDVQRYGAAAAWVLSNHDVIRHTTRLGPRRARAATLLMLALPGSAYLYQGEELGLHEAAGVPAELIADPAFRRHVQAQEHDPASTLTFYRQALGWRRKLQSAEYLEWMPGTSGPVLHFGRPGGWRSVTNFGPRAAPLPQGTVVVASAALEEGLLPADTTAWIITGS